MKEEKDWFDSHRVYGKLPPGLVGTPVLIDKLTQVLFKHIRRFLPEIKKAHSGAVVSFYVSCSFLFPDSVCLAVFFDMCRFCTLFRMCCPFWGFMLNVQGVPTIHDTVHALVHFRTRPSPGFQSTSESFPAFAVVGKFVVWY